MSKVGLHIATFYWPFNTFSQLKPLKTVYLVGACSGTILFVK